MNYQLKIGATFSNEIGALLVSYSMGKCEISYNVRNVPLKESRLMSSQLYPSPFQKAT